MATTSIKATFDVDALTITFDIVGDFADVEYYVGVEGPYGTIKALDTGSPDLSSPSGQVVVTSVDPLDAGDYILKVTAQDQVDIAALPPAEAYEYEFCFRDDQMFDLVLSDDCKTLYLEDNTTYPTVDGEDFERLIILSYPVLDKIETPADLTFTEEKNLTDMAQPDGKIYEYVTWNATGTSNGQFLEENGIWTVSYPATYGIDAETWEVICNYDLCNLLDCLDEFWTKVNTEVCGVGTFENLPASLKAQIHIVNGYMSMFAFAKECKDQVMAKKYYNLLAGILKCTGATSTPNVVQSPAPYGDEWTNVTLEAGFTTDVVNPLQVRIINSQVFFRGQFQGAAATTGTKLVDVAFWDTLGVQLGDVRIASLSVTLINADILDDGVAYADNGSLYIRALQGYNAGQFYTITDPLLLR
jgi:hypothetical protein